MSHPSTSTGVQAGQPHVNAKESRLHDRLEKIDKAATAVLDNYLKLFEHAKVRDENTSRLAGELALDVHAAKIASNAEELNAIAGDLRAQLQIHDSAAAEERVKNRRQHIRQVLRDGAAELRGIQEAVEKRLKDLELHYTKSKYRNELMG